MATRKLDDSVRKKLLHAQRNEITEHHIYARLAAATTDKNNSRILRRISDDEKRHYDVWKQYTEQDIEPSRWNIWKYYLVSRVFGLTFGVKLMEQGEGGAQGFYAEIAKTIPAADKIRKDEMAHEKMLIGMIDEERLKYVGSIVLGLNDALVELTGALAGFTLALSNASMIAMTGLITGIAAALSMAGSEYLSTKSEDDGEPKDREEGKNAKKASLYTGIAYIITVMLLIMPFLLLRNVFLSLALTLTIAVMIIWGFTYYISVAKDLPFWKRFLEMAGISLGVALISFGIGFVVKLLFNLSV